MSKANKGRKMPKNPAVKVLMVQKPVDGGKWMIGMVECPECGETHYTFEQRRTGLVSLYCQGKWLEFEVTAIL